MMLQAQLSYAATDEEARAAAFDQWRQSALDPGTLTDLALPEDFERESARVRPDDLDRSIRISSDPGRHAAWIAEYVEMGFEENYLHQVARDQARFLEDFGARVLPRLARPQGAGR